jgi:hypothetical protein
MGLGIHFHHGGSEIDFSQPGFGLSQSFYELLFRYFNYRDSGSLLKKISQLGYDDDLFLNPSQVNEVLIDLEQLFATGKFSHPQIQPFCGFLREALDTGCGLVIWGDMYPDLSDPRYSPD